MFFLGSKINIGAQSAVNIPKAYLFTQVTSASPVGFFFGILFIEKTLLLCV